MSRQAYTAAFLRGVPAEWSAACGGPAAAVVQGFDAATSSYWVRQSHEGRFALIANP